MPFIFFFTALSSPQEADDIHGSLGDSCHGSCDDLDKHHDRGNDKRSLDQDGGDERGKQTAIANDANVESQADSRGHDHDGQHYGNGCDSDRRPGRRLSRHSDSSDYYSENQSALRSDSNRPERHPSQRRRSSFSSPSPRPIQTSAVPRSNSSTSLGTQIGNVRYFYDVYEWLKVLRLHKYHPSLEHRTFKEVSYSPIVSTTRSFLCCC